jgi:hypothetical protein
MARTQKFPLNLVISTILLVAVSGCMSTEELRKQDMTKCAGYGFRVGTTPFAQCMMQMEKDRDNAYDCLIVSLGAYSAASQGQEAGDMSRASADCKAGRQIRPPAPIAPAPNMMPKNTSCTSAGNSINCITY